MEGPSRFTVDGPSALPDDGHPAGTGLAVRSGSPVPVDHEEVMTMRDDWVCAIGYGRCKHTGCKPVPDPFAEIPVQTLNAAPDGVTPDEWRRAQAVLTVATMSKTWGTEFLTVKAAVQRADRLAEWIRTGVLPDA